MKVLDKTFTTDFTIAHNNARKSQIFNLLSLSDRIKRLLAVAFVNDCSTVEKFADLVGVVEKNADGEMSDAVRQLFFKRYIHARRHYPCPLYMCHDNHNIALDQCSNYGISQNSCSISDAIKNQVSIISKMLPSPYPFDPFWKTETAVLLARQMYDSHDFSPMPILADALQDSGCNEEDLLEHMRTHKHWYRGCWIIDMLLGKRK